MATIVRVSPDEARKKVQSGSAILVCSYQNDEKFTKNHLAGALSYNTFQQSIPRLGKGQEIIFYCA